MRSSDWSSDVCSSDLPEAGFLAAEYFITGVASLLGQLRAAGDAPSLRLYIGDARDLLDCLPDGVLDRIFILFPDPWPKRRHHKRRLIQNATVAQLARVLKDGGELRFATDDASYRSEEHTSELQSLM